MTQPPKNTSTFALEDPGGNKNTPYRVEYLAVHNHNHNPGPDRTSYIYTRFPASPPRGESK